MRNHRYFVTLNYGDGTPQFPRKVSTCTVEADSASAAVEFVTSEAKALGLRAPFVGSTTMMSRKPFFVRPLDFSKDPMICP